MSEMYKGYIVNYPDTGEFEASIHCKWDTKVFPLVTANYKPPTPPPMPTPTPLPPAIVNKERVRAPTIPTIPPPATDNPHMVPPQPRGAVTSPTNTESNDRRTTRRTRDTNSFPPMPLPPVSEKSSESSDEVSDEDPNVGTQETEQPPIPADVPPVRVHGSKNRKPQTGLNGPAHVAPMQPRRTGSRAGTGVRASLAVVVSWIASTSFSTNVLASQAMESPKSGDVLPDLVGKHVAVILFAGKADHKGVVQLAQAFKKRGAYALSIDILIGGRLHDLLDVTPDGIGYHLLRAADKGEIQSLHSANPCHTFSVALDNVDMVRSAENPMGIPGLPPRQAAKVFNSNSLLYFTLDLARRVMAGHGEVTIENPAPRMDVSLPHVYWSEKAHHANLFRTKPVEDFKQETGAAEITFPLCACGATSQKYTTILATPGAAVGLLPLDGLVCGHDKHSEHAYGTTSEGRPGALLSGVYPYILCVVIACSHLQLTPPGITK